MRAGIVYAVSESASSQADGLGCHDLRSHSGGCHPRCEIDGGTEVVVASAFGYASVQSRTEERESIDLPKGLEKWLS
ncbi:MAG: hypothetical protein KKA97_11285 [Actinobacteria bacterium]|nr:hypothetical protein [Actinomycetota bacterium]